MKLIDKFFRSRLFVFYLPVVLFFLLMVLIGWECNFLALLVAVAGWLMYGVGIYYLQKDRAIIKRV